MNARALAVTGVSFVLATATGCRPRASSADARDCFRLEAPSGPVGFGAVFSVRATIACDIAGGHIAWRQLAGPALQDGGAQSDGKIGRAHV